MQSKGADFTQSILVFVLPLTTKSSTPMINGQLVINTLNKIIHEHFEKLKRSDLDSRAIIVCSLTSSAQILHSSEQKCSARLASIKFVIYCYEIVSVFATSNHCLTSTTKTFHMISRQRDIFPDDIKQDSQSDKTSACLRISNALQTLFVHLPWAQKDPPNSENFVSFTCPRFCSGSI